MFRDDILTYQNNMIEDINNLIRITSINIKSQGTTLNNNEICDELKYTLEKGKSLGLVTKLVDNHIGYIQEGNGEYTIGVFCNLKIPDDKIDECINSEMDYIDNNILENSIAVITIIYATKILKDKGLISNNNCVKIIMGTKNEGNYIKYYRDILKAPNIGFSTDGYFPGVYGEKGIIDLELYSEFKIDKDMPITLISINGGESIEKVPKKATFILSCDDYFREKINKELKIFCKQEGIKGKASNCKKLIQIEFEGSSTYSSNPEKGLNPISYGMKFMGLFSEFMDKNILINQYNSLISTTYYGEKINCKYEDLESGKLTLNVGIIDLCGEEISIKIGIRYPISNEYYDIIESVRRGFKYSIFKVNVISHFKPIYCSENNMLLNKLVNVYRECTGDFKSVPIVVDGGTHAKTMENIIAFGTRFQSNYIGEYEKTEFTEYDKLIKITEIYTMALYQLLK